jgi:hypothetical protein
MVDKTSRSDGPVLLHPGYHKTGTTWFQKSLFRPEFGLPPIMTHAEVFATLVRPHGLAFDPRAAQAIIARNRGRGAPGSVDVISSEILSGNPFYGGRESETYGLRLKAVAPNAKVLLSIREQSRALTSVYMQYLTRAGTLPPKRFFADDPELGYFTFAPEHFEYDRLARMYAELFGIENVLVVTQEALARDALATARTISAFAGVSANFDLVGLSTERVSASQPEHAAPVLRRLNHFRRGPAGSGINLGELPNVVYRATGALNRFHAIKSTFARLRPVTAEVMQRYSDRFAESNRRLKALLGDRVDLTGYQI